MGEMVRKFVNEEVTPLSEVMQRVKEGIRQNESSRRITYKYINPEMSVHYVYRERHVINENHRLSFTQFRVSGHSLVCETGRWNRRGRGRLPTDERLCRCGHIQTEQHVIQECPLTQHIRDLYQVSTMEELFSDQLSPETLCRIIHEVLNTYK